jgi:hypothetical protein
MHEKVDTAAVVQRATQRFVKMLFARDRVEKSGEIHAAAPAAHGRHPRTHALVETPKGLKLVRRRFDCGCHW